MTQVFDDIKIDAEFASLIPPLSTEERQQLEENIIEHGGARDPLVVWAKAGKLTLLDGHNRYEICSRLGLPFDIEEISFTSREEASDWIDRNQLGRRNLDPRAMSLLRGRRYNRAKKQGERTDLTSGQNVQKSTAAERLAAEHGVNEKTIRRDGDFAEAVEALGIEAEVISGEIDTPKHEIVAAAKSLPEQPTQEQVAHAVEAVKSRPHVANNAGDNEWYTPDEYLVAARLVVGEFDLDPASNPVANEKVRAATYYTAENSGLTKDWRGVVWMNPPYESKLIGQFAEKLCDSFASGEVTAAVVLVNNATETRWFQAIAEQASAVCFPKGRVKFWHPRKEAVPLQGQAVLYLGDDTKAFVNEFSSFGFCMEAPNELV